MPNARYFLWGKGRARSHFITKIAERPSGRDSNARRRPSEDHRGLPVAGPLKLVTRT